MNHRPESDLTTDMLLQQDTRGTAVITPSDADGQESEGLQQGSNNDSLHDYHRSVTRLQRARRRRFVQAALTMLTVLVVGVAGCSTGNDDSSADDMPGDEDETDPSQDLPSDAASDELGSADDGVDSELTMAANAQAYSLLSAIASPPPEYFQAVKDCMDAQGFEFVIDTPERLISQDDLTALLEEVASLNPTSSLFRNRYGYGVTTIGAYLDVGTNRQDPNLELLNQMSDSEIQAWVKALYGSKTDQLFDSGYDLTGQDFGLDLAELVVEPGGCLAEAGSELEVDIGMAPEDSELLDSDLLAERLLQIGSTEEYVVLEQEWARCAAEQGFGELTSINAVTVLLWSKFEKIRRPSSISGVELERLLGLTKVELDSLTNEEVEDRLNAIPFRYTLEDLEPLQQEELEMAHRLKDCDRTYWTGYAELEDRLFPDG